MQPTYEDFVVFVRDQDPNKPIDHSSWETCAVGEWTQHDLGEYPKFFSHFIQDAGFPEPIDELLNVGGTMAYPCGTYGELKEAIDAHEAGFHVHP